MECLSARTSALAVPGRIGVAGAVRHQMQGGCAPDISFVPVTKERNEKCGARSGGYDRRRDLATGRPSGRVDGCDDWSGYGSRLQARPSPRHAG